MIVSFLPSGPWLERALLALVLLAPTQEKPRRAPKSRESGSGKYENLIKLPEDYVRFVRVPDGGLGPRIALAGDELALLYFVGSEEGGDLFVARSRDEAQSFDPSRRVNAEPGSVAAPRGSHTGAIDLGPDGTVHVAWHTRGEQPGLAYARAAAGADFVAPVDLGAPPDLCSLPGVALDREGRLHVVYAAREASEGSEAPSKTRIWLRTSDDGGAFSEAVAIDRVGLGVSGESALAAHVDEGSGTMFVLYRAEYLLKEESKSFSRGMRLLSREGSGGDFQSAWVDNWRQPRDPRSSAGLGLDPRTTIATWDSGGQVFWATIRHNLGKVNLPMEPRIDGPAVVRTSASGAGAGDDVFLAWVERPKGDPAAPARIGWRVWQRFSRAPLGDGHAPEPPGAGTPAAFARDAGGYTVVY